MGFNSCLAEVVPYAAMLIMECISVGGGTLSKAAMSKGMSHFVFVFYTHALSFLLIFAICLIFHREKWAPLNFSICKFFFICLLGSTINPNCFYAGIDYSSPTLGAGMRNLIPAFTFLLAVIFRMETLNLRSRTSQVKIVATFLTIFGGLVLIFYKGSLSGSNLLSMQRNWVTGGLLFATSSLCLSIWIISQGTILKEYPSELTVVTLHFLFGSIQCAVVALVAEGNNPNAWKLRPDVELFPVMYTAIFPGLAEILTDIWCIKKKGPVFVAMFKPTGIAIAAVTNFIFLGERLHTGTIVGSIIVIVGFYGVMWAKSKDKEDQDLAQEKMPLLQDDRDVLP